MTGLAAAVSAGLAVALSVASIDGWTRPPVRVPTIRSPRTLFAGIGAAGVVLVALDAWVDAWAAALPPSVLAGLLPAAIAGHRARRQRRTLQAAWPDALRDLVSSLRAGASIEGAMRELARTGPGPLRQALIGLEVRASVVGLVTALEEFRERLGDATTDRVVEVLVVAAERGGSIVPDLLSDLAASVTRDGWMAEELETAVLEHRINAWAVFSLPWLVLLVLVGREGPFRDFYRSGPGGLVIAAGAAASALGIWWVLRLGRTEPEPRPFGPGQP